MNNVLLKGGFGVIVWHWHWKRVGQLFVSLSESVWCGSPRRSWQPGLQSSRLQWGQQVYWTGRRVTTAPSLDPACRSRSPPTLRYMYDLYRAVHPEALHSEELNTSFDLWMCLLQPAESATEDKKKGKSDKAKKCIRTAAGTSWEDASLLEWESGTVLLQGAEDPHRNPPHTAHREHLGSAAQRRLTNNHMSACWPVLLYHPPYQTNLRLFHGNSICVFHSANQTMSEFVPF